MQVVILAGGMGTRIQAIAKDIPKALIPIAGRPFIEHQFELLRKYDIRNVLLCIGYMADQISGHVGDGSQWGMKVSYSYEDPKALLGTGGAVAHVLSFLEDEFLVLYGDSYLPTDYRAVIAAFKQAGTSSMMCVYKNQGQWDQSNVHIEAGRVVLYSKSAPPGEVDYIDYGLTAYKKDLIREYRDYPTPLDLEQILQDQVQKDQLAAFEVKERFYEIGKPSGLEELEEYLNKGHTATEL